MVHILPHERMDLYRKIVGKLEGMRMTLLQEKCVCKKDGSTKEDDDFEEGESRKKRRKSVCGQQIMKTK